MSARPPPRTMRSRSRTSTRLATPRATSRQNPSRTRIAPGSPSAAAPATWWPVIASAEPARTRPRSNLPASAASRPIRPSAVPDAKYSHGPRCPVMCSGPWASTTMCPDSPANPLAPCTSRPSRTKPVPIPVPSATKAKLSEPRPAPSLASAHVPAVASLPTFTGTPRALSNSGPIGNSTRFGRLGE